MGEFNVNKSDGSLEQTAGMPETYPAEQVMMSDGVTSVEEKLDDSGWINPSTNIYYRKKNGFVNVKANHTMSASDAWETIFTLPEGYRPAIDVFIPVYVGNMSYSAQGWVKANGDVLVIGTNGVGVALYTMFLAD